METLLNDANRRLGGRHVNSQHHKKLGSCCRQLAAHQVFLKKGKEQENKGGFHAKKSQKIGNVWQRCNGGIVDGCKYLFS